MATVSLIIYSTATADAIVAAMTAIKYCHENTHTVTLKDLTGIATGDVDTYLGTLTADTYDNIYLACPCEATSNSTPTGTINCTQQYTLRALLKTASQGTLSDEISNATTYSATTIGDSAITDWTTNSLAGSFVVLTGGTGANQLSEVKSNTTTVATIRGTFYDVPDSSTDFKTLTGCQLYLYGKTHTDTSTTKTPAVLAWESLYPTTAMNPLTSALGGNGDYSIQSGTSTGIGATSLTDSSAPFVASALIGKYVQIYSATTNGYQYGLITANSTTVLTVAGGWSMAKTPTGTPTYKIVDSLSRVFRDLYSKYFVLTYLTDPSVSESDNIFAKVNDNVNGWSYFAGTVLSKGSIMFEALRLGVTA